MADVLSQSEIDALLSSISSGGDTGVSDAGDPGSGSAKAYDFRTANRFNKEQIRTLNVIYDTFARLLSSYLSGTLRAMCTAEVTSVEELKYYEFVNALPSPIVLAITQMPPLAGSVLLEMSPSLSYAIISRLLGGQPEKENLSRNFTEIELVLLERVVRQFLPLFGESWEKVIGVSASLDRIETSPQFAQIVAMNETVAIITINVTLDETEGMFVVCLPHLALEPINQHLTTKYLYQSGFNENSEIQPAHEDIRLRLQSTPLEVTASFNNTLATVYDVLTLQKGDVLTLDHDIRDKVTLRVGHLPKFSAEIGVKENRYALKITDIIRKGDAEDD